MKYYLTIILLLYSHILLNAQKDLHKLDSILNKIQENGILKGFSAPGYKIEMIDSIRGRIIPNPQFARYEYLRDSTSIPYQISLLKHKNKVIKCYASWALIENNYNKLDEVFLALSKSKKKIRFNIDGPLFMTDPYAAFYYFLRNKVYYDHSSPRDSILLKKSIENINKIILQHPRKYDIEYALKRNNENPNTYNLIKKNAHRKKVIEAYIELAKYKKIEDISFFLSLGEESFAPISHFPHEYFWNFLLEFENTNLNSDYIDAVASFKSKSSNTKVTSIYEELKKRNDIENIYNLSESISNHYNEVYEDIAFQIFLEYKFISTKLVSELTKKNPTKSKDIFVRGLIFGHESKFIDWWKEGYFTDTGLLEQILSFIHSNSKEETSKILNHLILYSDFETAVGVLNFLKKNKIDVDITKSILNRLTTPNKAYQISRYLEHLSQYLEKINKEELGIILYNTQEYWNWGNWSNRFNNYCEEHNIKLKSS